jgi:8-oxo-dGTP pyrophosphatase MutT (NUDIX family)
MPALTQLLTPHRPEDAKETGDLATMLRYAGSLAAPFSRAQEEAHFTGSAVVVDPPGRRVCLVHHAKFDLWVQPGGHAEPEDGGDLEATALREAGEETGMKVALHPSAPKPLDVDIHRISARKGEPEHLHLDVRFLVVAQNPEALAHQPEESHGAAWLSFDEALARTEEAPLRRLLEKARRICAGAVRAG